MSFNMLHRTKTFTLPQLQHKDIEENIQSSKFSVFGGLLLAFSSGIFYAIAAVIVKQMQNIHPGQLAVYRYITVSLFALPAAVRCQKNFLGPKKFRYLLILNGFLSAANLFLNFISFRYLPLGESAVIIFSAPVFVTVAARVCLKEPCGFFQSITVLLTVIGILLTTKIPLKLSGNSIPYTKESLSGIIAAIASMFLCSCRFILFRMVKNVHHAIIMFNCASVATIGTFVLTAATGEFTWHECELQGWYIIILGVVSYIGQTLLIAALQCELAGPVSTMRAASEIVLSFVWQTVLFQDIPDTLSISGAVLVGFCVIFVGFKKFVSSLPPESKHYFSWVNR